VEASNTPTIRRLTPSHRHQLPRIALVEARLELARDEQKVVTAQVEKLTPYGAKLESEVGELKIEVAQMKAVLPQLDKVASTTALMTDTVKIVLEANSILGATLTPTGAVYSDTPQVIKLTKGSESECPCRC
jgi:hypothetical protein